MSRKNGSCMFKNLLIVCIIISSTMQVIANENQYICADRWPKASPPYHFKPNECGPDSPLAEILPNNFGSVALGEACNKHDRCWMEMDQLNRYGRCEARFTKDLIEACSKAEICFDTGFKKRCVPNPMEIAACQSMIVPAYTSASAAGVMLQLLEKSRKDQKEFEKCVTQYGYEKRPQKK